MQAHTLLYTLLKDAPEVKELVGSRVFPLRIPQNTSLPAITYQLVGGDHDRCRSYGRFRFQVSLFAKTYAQASTLSEVVQFALDGYEDGETLIEADAPPIDQHSDDSAVFYRTQDYFIDIPNPTRP